MKIYFSMLILPLILAGSFLETRGQENDGMESLYRKKKITVVVTDSGLGGLSVMSDIADKIEGSGCYKEVNLIYANALFNAHTGYNTLQTRAEKIEMFSSVLTGIEKRYHPDVIMVACNTLSVLLSEIPYVNESHRTVIGIIEPGVRMIAEKLNMDDSSEVIIFGTETTISEGSHRKALMDLNIHTDRIVQKTCPQLQSYIEQDPFSEETEMLIGIYLNEALAELKSMEGPVYLSLNCSHFGYSEELWQKAGNDSGFKIGQILNPNFIMGDILFGEKCAGRYKNPKISYAVVSGVELLNMESMFRIFAERSPRLAEALKNYKIDPGLFDR